MRLFYRRIADVTVFLQRKWSYIPAELSIFSQNLEPKRGNDVLKKELSYDILEESIGQPFHRHVNHTSRNYLLSRNSNNFSICKSIQHDFATLQTLKSAQNGGELCDDSRGKVGREAGSAAQQAPMSFSSPCCEL
jgi:hypothetical protein